MLSLSMADQPLNVLRQADQPVTAGSSCLEWLLELPPAAVGRSKEAIDAELRQVRDW